MAERLAVLDHLTSVDAFEKARLKVVTSELKAKLKISRPGYLQLLLRLGLEPEDDLVFYLCEGIALTDRLKGKKLSPRARQTLVNCLDSIAAILGRKLPLARASGDSTTDTKFLQDVQKMSAAFQRLKIEALLPSPAGVNRVMSALIDALLAQAGNNWQQMPKEPNGVSP